MDLRSATAFSRAMVRALRDSSDVEQLLIGEEISSIGRMRALLPLMQGDPEGRALLAERPLINTRTVDFEALRALPVGTLGRAYVGHLARCGLDPDALTTRVTRGQSDEENYLLERIRQTHDLWHTALGLGAQAHEEVLVHAFQWPQLRMPYSALVVFFGTIKHLIGEARLRLLRHALLDAHRAGSQARPLLPFYWERHWHEPIEQIRAQLALTPASGWSAFR